MLHVVLASPHPVTATRLANGTFVPITTITSAAHAADAADAAHAGAIQSAQATRWPCAALGQKPAAAHLRAVLLEAGSARFAERAARFTSALPALSPATDAGGLWTLEERVLWVALAEALGYGRDRAALRMAGTWLAEGEAPEVGYARLLASGLGRLDQRRLDGLLALRARFLLGGLLAQLARALGDGTPEAAGRAICTMLQVPGSAISPGRAAIVVANAVLPFIAAWGAHTGDAALAQRAERVFGALAGLPANAITRTMTRQLGLARLPAGAQAQQGLHHIWATHCREKRCAGCPCAIGPPPPASV